MSNRGNIVQCARVPLALSTAKQVSCPGPTLLSYPLIDCKRDASREQHEAMLILTFIA